MAVEIERKFLIDRARLPEIEGQRYVQGFISTADNAIVRVRICGDDELGLLVIKGPIENITRPEFDYEIPVEDAKAMLKLCKGKPIEKIRYKLNYKGHDWVVDEFLGDNSGLWLAEIELQDENESFERPPWLGREVSHDRRYYNVNLVRNPYKNWRADGPKSDLNYG